MHWRTGVLLLSTCSMLVLSGCFGESNGPPEDPELVAHNAIKSFGAAAGSQDGGDIKRISGSFQMKDTGPDEDGFSMAFGAGSVDMAFEWGKDDVVRFTIGMSSGGMTMQAEAWCTPTQQLFKWGNDVYESRPAADPGSSDDLCGDMDDSEMPTEGLDMFSSEEFEGLELQDIETASDGTITATFHDPEENGTITATVDPKGRVTRIAMDSPEGSGAFDITYGKRAAISPPAATKKLPAEMSWSKDLEGGTQTATITHSPYAPPLDEMQARLVLHDWENDATTVVVSFPAEAKGEQSKDGYTFQYNDNDADGRVTENDTFTFAHADWEGEYWTDEEPDMFDEWAGVSVNEGFTPAPGLGALIGVALLGLAFVARRRSA